MLDRAQFVGVVVALLVGSLLAGLYWRSRAAESSQGEWSQRRSRGPMNCQLPGGINDELDPLIGHLPLVDEGDMSLPTVRSVEHPVGAEEDTLGDRRSTVGDG